MPQVSYRKLRPTIEQDLLNSLSYTVKEVKTKSEADIFLSSVLTETERLMISKRVMAAFLLDNKVEEKTIGDVLKLTQATITRLKMWVKLRGDGFSLVIKKLKKKSRENVARQIFYRILNYSINAAFGRIPKMYKI